MKWLGDASPVALGKEAVRQYTADDVGGMAAELTYRFFLAMFPFFIFLAALGGFAARALEVDDPTGTVMDWIGDALPADAAGVVETQLTEVIEGRDGGLLSIGIIGALWAASGGISAFIKATNRAYDVSETRPFYKRYGLALGITILAGLFVVGAFLVFFVTQFFGQHIADRLGMGDGFTTALDILRWPTVILLLMFGVGFMYWIGPNIEGNKFRLVTPGAVLFIVVWVGATLLFGWYVGNMGNYQATYGTLGGVVVALLWLYITSVVLILGAEVNAIVEERVNPELAQERRRKTALDGGRPDSRQHTEDVPIDSPRRKGFLPDVPEEVEGRSERVPEERALRGPHWEQDDRRWGGRRERAEAERVSRGRPSGRPFRGSPQRLARVRERREERAEEPTRGGRGSILPALVAMFVAAVTARRMAR